MATSDTPVPDAEASHGLGVLAAVPGVESAIAWFGCWPTFHDAEVLELHLDRSGKSRVTLHAWIPTGETCVKNGMDCLKTDRHAVVRFLFEKITDLELTGFSCQNVISGLELETKATVFRLTLHPCYGVAGFIEAQRVRIEVVPGEPDPSQWSRPATE